MQWSRGSCSGKGWFNGSVDAVVEVDAVLMVDLMVGVDALVGLMMQ